MPAELRIPKEKKLLPRFPIKRVIAIGLVSWTLVILASLLVNLAQHEHEIESILLEIGRSSIRRDILFRQWNTMHGGVYAPITESSRPNPYLTPELVPERDLATGSGRRFTMINPAYMTRQVYELARQQNQVSGHLTSLNPINPKNRALPWEVQALEAVAAGAAEYSEIVQSNGEATMRMLLPLVTEKACLKCHAQQGYQEGDLRGGISVELPLAPYHDAAGGHHLAMVLGHVTLWLVGGLGLGWWYLILQRGEAVRRQAEAEIVELAHYDQLTGLVNRHLLEDRIQQALVAAKRHRTKVGLMYLDLDRFKPINDTFGHEAGDEVLREVGRRLVVELRETDTVARLGGDEFVVVLQDMREKSEAGPVVERLLARLREPIMLKGVECSVAASVGISCFPDDGDEMKRLLALADEAMYRAKAGSDGAFEYV